MNREALKELANIRIKEAQILFEKESYSGGYYLLGYAVECALKAVIAKQIKQYDFPDKKLANDSHSHKLSELIGVAGLKKKLEDEEKNDDDFKNNWAITKDWSERARYELKEKTVTENFFNAILDEQSGILTWLKKNW